MSTTSSGRFVWHELLTPEPEAAVAFYRELVGWKTNVLSMDADGDYTILRAGDRDVGGIVAQAAMGDAAPHWNIYFTTHDADAAARQAGRLGGSVVSPATDIPDVGRFAVLRDPQGATFSVFTPAGGHAHVHADVARGPGEFCWVELQTSDPRGALAFYQGLFGWMAKERPGMGGYQAISRASGKQAGGLVKKASPGPSAWLQYLAVGDVDATVDRAKQLRATVVTPAADIPGVGRYAVIQDPTGATLALFRHQ